ncbi:hypothetical protein PR003_g6508 [Phytophthora rubi]|uniref:Uncharacterized protein n=1 Tax=Phytophthora rubi TaxID=129364 RepID=A0A6A3NAJ8_9STRA|nr:hypothetical protein PR002_g6341 [Phytophthora rubi]KAE9042451.1 hypothetical protein PR001_g6173 [Phytophthora rubi]KAE9348240.1 hypothetical protein PR003_g6508 [Phytophthora rubi]
MGGTALAVAATCQWHVAAGHCQGVTKRLYFQWKYRYKRLEVPGQVFARKTWSRKLQHC